MDILSTYPYREILSLIPHGQDRAISAGELASHIGIDKRSLRLFIERMRSEGACILSGNAGYWIPTDKTEALRWKKKMYGFMGKYAALARSVDKYLES